MKINIKDINFRIKILDDKKTKAIIGLDFGDFVIKGFRITESQYENMNGDKMWLIPPSYMGGGHYHPIFFIPDKEIWQELEKIIWDKYKKAVDEHYKKRLQISDEEILL